jgi:hypothetical protein
VSSWLAAGSLGEAEGLPVSLEHAETMSASSATSRMEMRVKWGLL